MEINLDWRTCKSELWPEVSYQIRPLKVWAFQELLTFWESQGNQGEGADPAIRVNPTNGMGLMEIARKILPEHLREFQGLQVVQDGETRPASPELLCEETGLMRLTGEIISQLVAISEVTGDAEKN